MKQAYKEFDFRPDTKALILYLDTLIGEYQAQGYTLSVRQLYYQLVSRDKVPNTEQSYKRVASIINDGRLAGLLDWDAIEDRGRDIEVRSRWESGASILRAVAKQFHMDLWAGQSHRVFVIVEKAALVGVLGSVCREFDVPLLAARGYPSVSVVREIVKDHLIPAYDNEDQTPVILHLGDHDPSGIDMTRDLQDRIALFMQDRLFELRRIALTMEQVDEIKPPPNPAKVTDSRFAGYQQRYGDESWELDALPPAYIDNLVRQEIDLYVHDGKMQDRRDKIEKVCAKLRKTAETFGS